LGIGKGRRVYEEKECRRKVDQERDDDPEFLYIVHIEYRGVLDLLVQEENAIYDQQDILRRGRKAVKPFGLYRKQIADGDDVKDQGAERNNIFEYLFPER
jgi:hypothetical protein